MVTGEQAARQAAQLYVLAGWLLRAGDAQQAAELVAMAERRANVAVFALAMELDATPEWLTGSGDA